MDRMEVFFSACECALSQINVKEVSPDVRMDELTGRLWRPLKAQLRPSAILARKSPHPLISQILCWGATLGDEYAVKKRFGSLREPLLSFAEMKRTATQVICIQSVALILRIADPAAISRQSKGQILSDVWRHIGDIIKEVHLSTQRRPAYTRPLQVLFSQISCFDFCSFLEHAELFIEEMAKSAQFELFVESLSLVSLKLFPSEELEYTLNFLEVLANAYCDAKGLHLRDTFSRTLGKILAPFVEVVSAEVNIAKWEKVFGQILLKQVLHLYEKQKYRVISIRILSILLCLCNRQIFYERWHGTCEVIATMIRDGNISIDYFECILRLIWVYCHRYPEAFATQTSRISKILAVLAPPNRRLQLDHELLLPLYYGCAVAFGLGQPQSFLRDIILPFLEGVEGSSLESFPYGRVTIGIKALLYFGTVASRDRSAVSLDQFSDSSELSIEELCDGFIHYTPDLVVHDSIERIRSAFVKVLVSLDNILWGPNLHEGKVASKVGSLSNSESAAFSCLKLIIETFPFIRPLFSSEGRTLEILLKYTVHADESVAEKAINAMMQSIPILFPDPNEILRLYWLFSSQFNAIPDRLKDTLLNCMRIFPFFIKLLTMDCEDSDLFSKEKLQVFDDIAIKALLGLLNVSCIIRERAVDALLCMRDFVETHEKRLGQLHLELESLTKISQSCLNSGFSSHSEALNRALFDILQHCPRISEISKGCIISRAQEIQSQLLAKSAQIDDCLVTQWSYYLASLFCFGVPVAESRRIAKKIDGINIFKMLSFSREDTNLSTLQGLFRFALSSLHNEHELVCECLAESASALNPKFLPEFFDSLEPYISMVSEDYRNVKYQVMKKSKKQDMLKIDLTRVLCRVVEKLSKCTQYQSPQFRPHQLIKRYIIEAYYFISEIDVEQNLPALKYYFCELTRSYHDKVINIHPRYEFFPFKLQTELFQSIQKWFDDKKASFISGKASSVDQPFESGSSLNSSTYNFKSISLDFERAYCECLASLCHGLLSPLPLYRNESIPSIQVIRWIDSLIVYEPWGPGLVRVAIRNILISNRAIVEKVIQKIYQPEIVQKYPVLSNAYFLAMCEALLDGKIEIPTQTTVAMLTFKSFQGSPHAKQMAEGVVRVCFQAPQGTVSDLPQTLCMISEQVISEFVLRVENLLSSSLQAFIIETLSRWLQKVILMPGNEMPCVLDNLALVTIRCHQRNEIEQSFPLWDSLLLWRHHVPLIVNFLIYLTTKYRNTELLEVSSRLIQHFFLVPQSKSAFFEAIVSLIEPLNSLKIRTASWRVVMKPNSAGDGSSPDSIATRIEALLQTSEKTRLDDEFVVGHLVMKWMADLVQARVVGSIDSPEIGHLCVMLCDSGLAYVRQWTAIVQSAFHSRPEFQSDRGLIALRWAVRCPIKTFSLLSWKSLSRLVGGLSTMEAKIVVPMIASYISLLCSTLEHKAGHDSHRVPIAELIGASVQVLESYPKGKAGWRETQDSVFKLTAGLLFTEELVIFRESLGVLGRSFDELDTGKNPIDLPLVVNLIKGYSQETTLSLTGSAACVLVSIYYRGVRAEGGQVLPMLIISLLPHMIVSCTSDAPDKQLIEAVGMICNLLEPGVQGEKQEEGKEKGKGARMAMRLLQSYGRKRYRFPIDAIKDLALIFSDPVLLECSAGTAYALATLCRGIGGRRREEVRLLAGFVQHWTRLSQAGLAQNAGSDPVLSWRVLMDSLASIAGEDGATLEAITAAVDELMLASANRAELVPAELVQAPKSLQSSTELSAIAPLMHSISREIASDMCSSQLPPLLQPAGGTGTHGLQLG